jgi:hypothetical protein
MASREEKAASRYKKAKMDKSMPEPVDEAQVDPASMEAGGGPNADGSMGDDPYMMERRSMMERHNMELRDMFRQHRGEGRTAFGRHEKEMAEMMSRHMGGGDKPRMGDKKAGDEE